MSEQHASTDDLGWNRLVILHGRVEQELARSLQRAHGLGLSEYRALTRLAESSRGELRIQELADAVGLNQSSVSRLVARLTECGLADRSICATDRRGVYTCITELGRQRQAAAQPLYRETLTAALDRAAVDAEVADAIIAVRASRTSSQTA